MSASVFNPRTITPLASRGFTHDFWHFDIDFLIATWVALAILATITGISHYVIRKKDSHVALFYEKVTEFFMDLCTDGLGSFHLSYFCFTTSLFLFTAFCCFVGLIPFVAEATSNVNTTLAIAICSFCYVQFQKIKIHGIKGFLREFIEPFFIMAPMHIVGEGSKIASMTFRLFGNVLGGGIIVHMLFDFLSSGKTFLAPIIFGIIGLHTILSVLIHKNIRWIALAHKVISKILNLLFLVTCGLQVIFGIGEGLLQAFVLTILTITFLALGMQHDHPAPHQPPLPKNSMPSDDVELQTEDIL
jgi:F-type H+-transporting ATPase subunit a